MRKQVLDIMACKSFAFVKFELSPLLQGQVVLSYKKGLTFIIAPTA